MRKFLYRSCFLVLCVVFGALMYEMGMYLWEAYEVKVGTQKTEQIVKTYNKDRVLDELRVLNEDTVGYLVLDGTEMAFPVVQSFDNEFYLKHNFEKGRSKAGSIFLDYRNDLDDLGWQNFIVYGHNRRDGIMFHELEMLYKQPELYEAVEVRLLTEHGLYVGEIFSMYVVDVSTPVFVPTFEDESQLAAYVAGVNEGVELLSDDLDEPFLLVTLTTCDSVNLNDRIVLHALLGLSEGEVFE